MLCLGLLDGFSSSLLDDKSRRRPNQGIWQSARSGLVVGLVGGLAFGLVGGLIFALGTEVVFRLVGGLSYGLEAGRNLGLFAGLAFGMFYGWGACIAHGLLRVALWRTGVLPLNLVPFLDYATERILLRRVGGGYLFIHPLLLKYFAEYFAEG